MVGERRDPETEGVREAATAVLAAMGARVEIDPRGDTLTRLARAGEAPAVAIVEAQGVPNLLHELLHVLQAGRLDDDHGIDYGRIPLDLDDPDDRLVFFQELACTVVSCGYVRGGPQRVDAWFVEQIGFQPIFFGLEHDPQRFWARVHEVTSELADELDAVVAAAGERLRDALASAGAAPEIAAPVVSPSFAELWRRNRARLPAC